MVVLMFFKVCCIDFNGNWVAEWFILEHGIYIKKKWSVQ